MILLHIAYVTVALAVLGVGAVAFTCASDGTPADTPADGRAFRIMGVVAVGTAAGIMVLGRVLTD